MSKSILFSPEISPEGKVVYSLLKGFCYKKDTCYPSIDKLMLHSGMGRNKTRRAIQELEDKNIVSKLKRGRGVPSTYKIKDVLPYKINIVPPEA